MKHWFYRILLLGFAQTAWCASEARLTLRVTDDTGNVVTNALVKLSTLDRWIPGEAAGRDILRYEQKTTDTNGTATLTIACKNGKIGYGVYVDKFSTGNYSYWMNGVRYYNGGGGTYYPTNKVKGKWQPWNPTLEVKAKRVINPIPMYAMRVSSGFKLLNSDDRPAFDLVKGDWVKPYGNGEVADFIFSGTYMVTGKTRFGNMMIDISESSLSMTFSNEDDGIQVFRTPPRQGSALRLPYLAPETGYNNSEKQQRLGGTTDPSKGELDEDLNYFFRVRTRKNDRGEIVSALYGKIYGPVEFRIEDEFSVQFTYYLNPEPNDRNTEFDTKRNLFPSSRSTWNLLP